MGKLMFGWDDKIACIQSVGVKGQDDEPLCLAYKTSKLFVGAGVYLKDEGYVLGDPAQKDRFYPWPEQAQVKAWQAEGLLPDPLPGYSIPALEYAFAYSLWLVILVMVAWALGQRALTKRRQARDALIPVSRGPPQVVTEGDKFINQTVTAMLQPGEQVQHQALALRSAEELSHVYFVALTSQRLILISSKRKFRGYVFENAGVEEVPRAQIADVTENAYELTFTLTTGGQFMIVVPRRLKEFSNQQEFVRDVPRLLAAVKAVGPVVQVA
ncbi:MAG: hypothetical protein Q8L48_04485 [Archangium sp.]|nr:hypothetical protein [Archangium sp.]